jgi:hypothetical protein
MRIRRLRAGCWWLLRGSIIAWLQVRVLPGTPALNVFNDLNCLTFRKSLIDAKGFLVSAVQPERPPPAAPASSAARPRSRDSRPFRPTQKRRSPALRRAAQGKEYFDVKSAMHPGPPSKSGLTRSSAPATPSLPPSPGISTRPSGSTPATSPATSPRCAGSGCAVGRARQIDLFHPRRYRRFTFNTRQGRTRMTITNAPPRPTIASTEHGVVRCSGRAHCTCRDERRCHHWCARHCRRLR